MQSLCYLIKCNIIYVYVCLSLFMHMLHAHAYIHNLTWMLLEELRVNVCCVCVCVTQRNAHTHLFQRKPSPGRLAFLLQPAATRTWVCNSEPEPEPGIDGRSRGQSQSQHNIGSYGCPWRDQRTLYTSHEIGNFSFNGVPCIPRQKLIDSLFFNSASLSTHIANHKISISSNCLFK